MERPLRIVGADPERAYKATEIKTMKEARQRCEDAASVIRNIHKRGMEYEPDTNLRDTEQIPLQEQGRIDAFLRREVLPHAPDAWYKPGGVNIGYEISFNRNFYKPAPLRGLEEIRADILALEGESARLLDDILIRETRNSYGKFRVYVDTSVIGGCRDDEFSVRSLRLIERCAQGELTLVVSELTLEELENAPQAVQEVLTKLGTEAYEVIPITEETKSLAEEYIESGALTVRMRNDARHIAAATLAHVDVLTSWNFRHIVKQWRIEMYNEVNRRMGYPAIDILRPEAIKDEK